MSGGATPRPWAVAPTGRVMRDGYSQPWGIVSPGAGYALIGGLFGDTAGGEAAAEANARLIVRAVNSHDALVSALRRVVEEMAHIEHGPDCDHDCATGGECDDPSCYGGECDCWVAMLGEARAALAAAGEGA